MHAPATSPSTPLPERFARSLRDIIDEIDTRLASAVQAGDHSLESARLELSHRLRRMRLQLDDLQAEAVHRARRTVRSADVAVHEHPYRAIGIGAAAGIVVGWLLARR